MKSFTYTIVDPVGIHAVPPACWSRQPRPSPVPRSPSPRVTKTVKSTQLMKLMGLGVKGGDTVTVTAEGPDEDSAISAMEQLFKENL